MKRPGTLEKPKYNQPDVDHYLVSVDLGKNKVGLAVWWVPVFAEAELVKAATVLDTGDARVVARVVRMAAVGWAGEHAYKRGDPITPPLTWVCEWPKKYKDKTLYHEHIDALHDVGKELGRLANGWSRKYLPGQWKGNVPKKAHHRRLRRLDLKDPPHEADHDAWDAIGIGAYALGLTRRGGVM